MKAHRLFLILIISVTVSSAQKFVRNLPSENLCQQLTPENCKNVDAVIVLKEQSFLIRETNIEYQGLLLHGPSTTRTVIMIVKLFNEAAIKRYGSFEYVYPEYFGRDLPNGFEVKARVMKPDRKIKVLSKNEIKNIVVSATSDGTPLARKVLFKMPDLAPGDILQIEYQFTEVFARSSSAIFFYNDEDYVLFSNLYITLPMEDKARYISLPEARIGQPIIQQISKDFGAGKTYVWMLRDLNAIPDEPYSRPFADQSLITAFIVEKQGKYGNYQGDWNSIAKNFYENYLNQDEVSSEQLESLGFLEDTIAVAMDFNQVDRLYRSLRKNFILREFSSLYPASKGIKNIFKERKADASDLAYIMFKILQRWQQDVHIVWIRDQRQGMYEESIPSELWFNRLGVLINIQGQEKLYDFDPCIPTRYVVPWFLRTSRVVEITEGGGIHKQLKIPAASVQDNQCIEAHHLRFDSSLVLKDSLKLSYRGAFAEKFRGEHYGEDERQIVQSIKSDLLASCFTVAETTYVNNFWDDNEVEIFSCGVDQTQPESVDNFFAFKLKNKLLDEFKNAIFSTVRRSDIMFDGPFQMRLTWTIALPPGYFISSKIDKQKFGLEGKMASEISFQLNKNVLEISANLNCSDPYIPLRLYPKLIQLLDDLLREINRDLVFKRI
ncbi:MAG: DUF3857 domain-containing protein [candidate division KSB1 bacterium]|nr:DUF3857 domain-containing protein [candidate division KSB1 bacterium]MDZ7341317.1 DUF3857 domain-containing protein [candidate division KSB1 bacterium]